MVSRPGYSMFVVTACAKADQAAKLYPLFGSDHRSTLQRHQPGPVVRKSFFHRTAESPIHIQERTVFVAASTTTVERFAPRFGRQIKAFDPNTLLPADASDKNFDEVAGTGDLPVFVEFYRNGCIPCRKMEQVLDWVSFAYAGKLKIVRVDAEENPVSVDRYGVTSVPTLVALHAGERVHQVVGVQRKSVLQQFIDTVLTSVSAPGPC
mmetsp:Transcript_23264/g.40032  ORF Transcript_23264/g.40032 Transcript_23264/m.40032 type:complete len:208 (+) Transcript_23264:66-689(+)|eukprot:CAMPEP_0196653302 /NCGR_PEP_ID=MMETSP1086-20130531/2924_1 /TAXON_ID=77921 /ORGANISM="Cyanoptyche  gloeocystis , Strain SAG4.97" /LENGTH=207 /DNA_ID=CAMNT_0041984431 /DNA_START=61 /DNA_END=684 /DNA_ORIENTATION=-